MGEIIGMLTSIRLAYSAPYRMACKVFVEHYQHDLMARMAYDLLVRCKIFVGRCRYKISQLASARLKISALPLPEQ